MAVPTPRPGRDAVAIPEDEAARLHQIIGDLGIPGFVDIHTHFMPSNVLAKVWDYFDRAPEHGLRPWPIAYRYAEPERIDRLRQMGVVAFTSMLYPHRPGMAEWLNTWSADFAARVPDCAHTCTFFPEPEAARYTGEALDAGARVFKAHLQVGDYDPLDPLLDPVWAQIAQAGAPVVIHCGSGPVAGRYTGADPIAELLHRHPDLALVIAHTGMPEYAQFLQLAETYRNVCLDTCMTFTPYIEQDHPFPPQLLPRLAQLQDKIILGSDFPNIPHPYLTQIESILGLDLGADFNTKVLYANGARLLQLAGSP
ncbi:MAG TPA: amidohydrolase family protein [Beutenbergiaceae bacterium]|nr:amidohydrolase family protein [Beutenbergiaceae bacterium]